MQRPRWLVLAAAIMTIGVATPAAATPATPSRLYETSGPHEVTVRQGGPDHTLFYPSDLGAGGAEHPVLIWGNGTGATPEPYEFALRHLASWGFVVAAANTTQSGSGQEMLAGARFLIAEDKREGSVFHGKIDETSIGAAGHSQGGGGAIAAGADPIVDATLPLQPGPQGKVGALHGPSFFVAGQLDLIVPSLFVRARYAGADQVPAVFGEIKGAGHFLLGDTRTRAVGMITAWFRLWLAGDERARTIFFGGDCGICGDSAWSSVDRNDKAKELPGADVRGSSRHRR